MKDLINTLSRLDKGSRKELRRVMTEIADEKLPLMKERAPLDEGDLRATGRYTVRAGPKQLIIKFHFGDDNVRYAARQHEDLEAKHKVGRAKYVESVILESRFASELAAKFDLAAAARG